MDEAGGEGLLPDVVAELEGQLGEEDEPGFVVVNGVGVGWVGGGRSEICGGQHLRCGIRRCLLISETPDRVYVP